MNIQSADNAPRITPPLRPFFRALGGAKHAVLGELFKAVVNGFAGVVQQRAFEDVARGLRVLQVGMFVYDTFKPDEAIAFK